MARVMRSSGEKVFSEVPVITPFSLHQSTASAYQALSGTSEKPSSAASERGAALSAPALEAMEKSALLPVPVLVLVLALG